MLFPDGCTFKSLNDTTGCLDLLNVLGGHATLRRNCINVGATSRRFIDVHKKKKKKKKKKKIARLTQRLLLHSMKKGLFLD